MVPCDAGRSMEATGASCLGRWAFGVGHWASRLQAINAPAIAVTDARDRTRAGPASHGRYDGAPGAIFIFAGNFVKFSFTWKRFFLQCCAIE